MQAAVLADNSQVNIQIVFRVSGISLSSNLDCAQGKGGYTIFLKAETTGEIDHN